MPAVAVVSCRFEWQAVTALFPDAEMCRSPFGQWFTAGGTVFFQGGWGKISAAASAQYAIDRWRPPLMINIGTCGGFPGETARGEVVLVERVIVYDIVEQMTGADAAIAHYTTEMDLSWVGERLPQPVRRATLVSADRDLVVSDLPHLKQRYGAVAGDWESGAIAWVAARNGVRCVILRGVSDIAGEAYEGNLQVYIEGASAVMRELVAHLPQWVRLATP